MDDVTRREALKKAAAGIAAALGGAAAAAAADQPEADTPVPGDGSCLECTCKRFTGSPRTVCKTAGCGHDYALHYNRTAGCEHDNALRYNCSAPR